MKKVAVFLVLAMALCAGIAQAETTCSTWFRIHGTDGTDYDACLVKYNTPATGVCSFVPFNIVPFVNGAALPDKVILPFPSVAYIYQIAP